MEHSSTRSDLLTYAGRSYLITFNYYSDFWELDTVPDTSSDTVLKHAKDHFACYGIPERVITDNGPQFRAQICENFMKQWRIDHITSSPYHNQSNGKAEVAEKLLKQC